MIPDPARVDRLAGERPVVVAVRAGRGQAGVTAAS
jgi:hypothetical protein